MLVDVTSPDRKLGENIRFVALGVAVVMGRAAFGDMCEQVAPRAGYVVRTAWPRGAHEPNFVRTMIRLQREQPAVDVVDDQRGEPTWTADVGGQIAATPEAPGLLSTWYADGAS